MAAEFSIEGSPMHKKAFLQESMRRFDLDLDRHFAASFGDVLRYGRSFAECIVGEPSSSILTMGGRKSTHFVLPEEHDQALEAIGRFFHKSATAQPPPVVSSMRAAAQNSSEATPPLSHDQASAKDTASPLQPPRRGWLRTFFARRKAKKHYANAQAILHRLRSPSSPLDDPLGLKLLQGVSSGWEDEIAALEQLDHVISLVGHERYPGGRAASDARQLSRSLYSNAVNKAAFCDRWASQVEFVEGELDEIRSCLRSLSSSVSIPPDERSDATKALNGIAQIASSNSESQRTRRVMIVRHSGASEGIIIGEGFLPDARDLQRLRGRQSVAGSTEYSAKKSLLSFPESKEFQQIFSRRFSHGLTANSPNSTTRELQVFVEYL